MGSDGLRTASRVHDMAAVAQDAALYRKLHRRTVTRAKELFAKRFRQSKPADATEVDSATLVMHLEQVDEFRKAEAAQGFETMRARLERELQHRRGRPVDLGRADRALADELAHELAAALWSSWLDEMSLKLGVRRQIEAADLDLSPHAQRLLESDLRHFGLSAADLQTLVCNVLSELARDDAHGGRVRLPLGLQVSTAGLKAFLKQRAAGLEAARPSLTSSVPRPTSQLAEF